MVALNGTPTTLPPFFQYNIKPLQIQVVDPNGTFGSSPYDIIELNGKALRVAITPDPTGSAGGPTALALETTWTWNSTGKYFTGSLDLSTAAIGTYIGTAAFKTANFEVTLVDGGNRTTLYQGTVTLRAAGDEGTATAPEPAELYLPKSDSDARYVKREGDAGEVIVVKSANGTYALEIVCNDDGTPGLNVITL